MLAEVSEGFVANEATPCGYEFRHLPRKCRRGGGVVIILKTSLKPKLSQVKVFKSFEYMHLSVRAVNKVLQVIVVYRPPPLKNNKLTSNGWFGEFTTLLEHFTPNQGCSELLITGDFNFHIDDKNDLISKSLQILHSFDLTQHVDIYSYTQEIVTPLT